MLFRNRDGSMIILDKYEFKNDELYYSKIKNIKFGKNDLLNSSPKNSANYSNRLINALLERTGNDLENQE
jgi:hypothetical protein